MKGERKKILFIHHGRTMGGAPTSMLNIIRYLDKSKFNPKILFIFNNPSIIEFCEKENIDYKVLNNFFFRKFYIINVYSEAKQATWRYYLRIYPIIRDIFSWLLVAVYYSKKIIKAEEVDIVHFNSAFLTDWLWGVRKLEIKKIVHVREPLASNGFGIKRAFYRYVLGNFANNIFAISEDNKRRLDLPDKTIVVYNFIKEPEKNPCARDENIIKVAYLGGDSTIKGFKIIMDSLNLIDPNITILMAGYLENKDSKYDRINLKYVGIFDNVYDLLLQTDILIFPSTVPHFAKPIIEAGMCRLPVIASDVEGMDEIVISGENGLLFKTGSALELGRCINLLARDSELRKQYGLANYNLVQNKFSIDSNIKIIERVYLS